MNLFQVSFTIKKGGNPMSTVTNHMKNHNKSQVMRYIGIFLTMTLCVVLLTGCTSNIEQNSRDVSSYFVKYDDATVLVDILLSEGLLRSYHSIGFISQESLGDFSQGKINAIKVYHPYVEGEYAFVNTDSIKAIQVCSYERFYEKYSPEKLKFKYGIKVN